MPVSTREDVQATTREQVKIFLHFRHPSVNMTQREQGMYQEGMSPIRGGNSSSSKESGDDALDEQHPREVYGKYISEIKIGELGFMANRPESEKHLTWGFALCTESAMLLKCFPTFLLFKKFG